MGCDQGFPNCGKGWREIPLSEEEVGNFFGGDFLPKGS